MSERNITFEIREHLGVITKFDSGWNRELNIISWNGTAAKYDLRDWDPHHERMSKGITLHAAEMRKIVDLYLGNNTRKAVEEGRAMEAERKQRQKKQIENAGKENRKELRDTASEQSDAASYEGALPPAPTCAEGEELQTQMIPTAETVDSVQCEEQADCYDAVEDTVQVLAGVDEEADFKAAQDGEETPF